MKKDFTNVLVTFSLIASMVSGGTFIYGKKVSADIAAARVIEENNVREQAILALQTQEQANEIQKVEEDRTAKEKELAQEKIRIAQSKDQSARAQAAYQAELRARQAELEKSNAAAVILAKQQADAKIQAQRLADQKAAAAAAKKASRKSRAS